MDETKKIFLKEEFEVNFIKECLKNPKLKEISFHRK
jgi:hypothetical protein